MKESDLESFSGQVPREAEFVLARPGAVKPAGWLREWAQIMARGYTSRMDEVDEEFVRAWSKDFQPRGKKLAWWEGTWSCEGGMYWFDGLVKLAFQLDDAPMIAKAKRRLDPLLDNMTDHPIGFCWWLDRRDPTHFQEVYDSSDWMVNWVAGGMARPISAWYQATGDERAKRALEAALGDDYWNHSFKNSSVDCVPGSVISLPSGSFVAARATGSEKIASALRAYASDYASNPGRETYGPPPAEDVESTLHLKRAEMIARKMPIRHGVVTHETLHSLFASAVVTGDKALWNSWKSWLTFLDKHARLPIGATVMDEEWGHPGPRRGAETCAIAAETWSRIDYLTTLGLGCFGDDVERAFYNAAPASVTRDCRQHLYFQSPNRLKSGDAERLSVGDHGYTRDQVTFSEKHNPLCCTAGLNRLVPDFVQAMWMTTREGGVVAALYGPCTFQTMLSGMAFAAEEYTSYPFDETITIRIKAAPGSEVPVLLRAPSWCDGLSLRVNGEHVDASATSGFMRICRVWKAGDTISMRLPMIPRVETYRDLDETKRDFACLSAGPILFARGFAEKSANEPSEPATVPAVDIANVASQATIERKPFGKAFDWPLDAPVCVKTRDADGEPLELVPYGCTKLRASMFEIK